MQARLLQIDTALLSQHVLVRRFREGDGAALYELVEDNYSLLYDAFPRTLKEISDPEHAEFFVRRRLADWHLQKGYCFGIWHNQTTELIGLVRLFHIDWETPKGEVGYFIDREYMGQGLMTEALRIVQQFAFKQLVLEKLLLRTAMENVASQRLARKCGFRREGDLRGDFRKLSGELIDTMLFGLTRSEYLGI